MSKHTYLVTIDLPYVNGDVSELIDRIHYALEDEFCGCNNTVKYVTGSVEDIEITNIPGPEGS